MKAPFDKDQIQDWIETREFKKLRIVPETLEPFEVAELIDELDSGEDIIMFRLLPHKLATDVFAYLTPEKQQSLVELLASNQARLAHLLDDMSADDRTDMLEEMPGLLAQQLLRVLSPEERNIATKLLAYPEESIGRLMTPDFVSIRPDFTIQQTLEFIRQNGTNSETLNIIYITDNEGHLQDDLQIRELLLSQPDQVISELLDNHFIALRATDDQETAVRVFRECGRVALPVTDTAGVLIGIVTIDDILEVAEEEATEDLHRFGSMQMVVNPLQAGIFQLYKKRIFWLLALVFMNIFSGAAIATFEQTIQTVVSLVFFLPLLIDSGGNTGSQSATLVIRAMATGDVTLKDWLHLILKEVLVALLLGATMAAGVALVASVRSPEIILVVSLSMVCIVLIGALFGMTLPFIFTKLGADPATASAPLITSVADISGVLIYFSIARWIFSLNG